MNEKNDYKEDMKLVNLKLNKFLLNIIKILGEEESLDADLITLVIEYLNNQIESLNKKIIDFYSGKLQDYSSQIVFNNNDDFWDFKNVFNKQDETFKIKDDYINLLQYLEKEKYNIQKKNKHQLKIQKRIPILSEILEKGLNLQYQDIEKKLHLILNEIRKDQNLQLYGLLEIES